MQNMHFELLSSTTVDLTSETVAEFAHMTPSPTERELREKRVTYLKEKVDAGYAMPFQWAKARYNGEWYRVNGQHSSAMLLEYGESLPEGLKAHIDEYKIEDREALALLFRQFDARASGRSPLDVSGAYQGLEGPLSEVSKNLAKLAAEGICWHRAKVAGLTPIRGDDVYAQLHEPDHHQFIIWMDGIIGPRQTDMKRMQLAAAMYETYQHDPDLSDEFWKQVASKPFELDEDHPALKLANWLIDAKDPKNRDKPPAKDFYQAGVYAYNAYAVNRDIKSINITRIKDLLRAK